jgi:hypothetical protein
MQEPLTSVSEFSSLPTPKARDHQAEGYEAGLRRSSPQVGTIVKGLVEGDERVLIPTPRANEPGSTSAGYGDSLNDFANRVVNGYARKDLELLRSPTASQATGGALGEAIARERGNTVGIRDQAMDVARANGLKVSREAANLPTPTTRDYKDGTAEHIRDGVVQTDTVARAVFNSGEILMPTTRVSMSNGPTKKEIDAGNPKSRIETEVMLGDVNWGKFEPAIRRWEAIIGRPAPAPTKPDGRDGAHRLSSKLTEWMIGLDDGWITDCGLSRTNELKAAGNGVVPQQAEFALRKLLTGIPRITIKE